MITLEMQENLFKFQDVDVFEQGIEQANRSLKEKKDFFLGASKGNLKIFFMDKSGLRKVETKIWTLTKQVLILKGSKIVPLSKIVAVA